jgi:hypothetical protein
MLSQTKHNPTRTTFHFPHAAPLLYTLMASSVKVSANKSFTFNYSQYIADSLLNSWLPAVY